MSSRVSNECLLLKTPTRARAGKVLVILSWGAVAWYRRLLPSMTVGELRRQLAKELGRLFDGDVVGLELLVTGTDIPPDLGAPLRELTHPPYRNVCLDVIAAPRSPAVSSTDSVGERLLRKHMSQERFQSGIDQQLWRLIELNWPFGIFGLRRKAKQGKQCEAVLRLRFDMYPLMPPQVEVWSAETWSALGAELWPSWFRRFVCEYYPEFADLPPSQYCPDLLRISAALAHRLKQRTTGAWNAGQEFTQLLIRAAFCFRLSQPTQTSHLLPDQIELCRNECHKNSSLGRLTSANKASFRLD